jgi:diguanylate cyclase (GGDEF)-like protein/PAS domain S-box-containing protein
MVAELHSASAPAPSIRQLLDARPLKLLALGFILIVLLMTVLVAATLSRIDAMRKHLGNIVTEHNSHSALTYRMLDAARSRSIALQRIVFDDDPFVRDAEMMRFYELATEVGAARNAFLTLELTRKERDLMQAQAQIIAEVLRAQQQVLEHVQAERLVQARAVLFNEATPAQLRFYDSMGEMIRLQQEEVSEAAGKAAALERQAHRILLLGGGGAVLLSVLIAAFSIQRMRRLMRGIRDGSDHLEETVAQRTAELTEREEIMRRMTSAANDAVIIIDDHDAVTFWNEAAERIFGYSAQEVLGHSLHEIIMPERYRKEYAPGFAVFSETGMGRFVGQTREVMAKRRGGGEFAAELSLSGVKIRGRWNAIGLVRDITDRKRAEDVLKQLATVDPLTGVANRRRFDEVMDAEIKRAERYRLPLTLLLFDIDLFKRINDEHGHLAGDRVLAELARLVAENVRANDHLARWGGEEFVVLGTHCDEDCMGQFAEKLRGLIAAYRFPDVGTVTCSFGVSALRPRESAASLVARADEALYQAKSLGRNRVCRARPVGA